jgi:hypothetical protein
MRVRSEDGAAHLAFRFQPDARSVELTLVAPRVSPGPVPVVTRTRLVDRRAGSDAAPLLEGRVSTGSGRPPTPPVLRFLQQRFWLPNGGPISEWTLELRTVAPDGAAPPALDVEVRVIADARPITAQEAALMRWRDSVPDPLAAPDRVREMVAQLSDDEVRYYTGFQDRAAFLKHWQRTGRSALRGPVGALVFTEEVQGLLRPGNPLPDGRYLHHNGKVPALLD